MRSLPPADAARIWYSTLMRGSHAFQVPFLTEKYLQSFVASLPSPTTPPTYRRGQRIASYIDSMEQWNLQNTLATRHLRFRDALSYIHSGDRNQMIYAWNCLREFLGLSHLLYHLPALPFHPPSLTALTAAFTALSLIHPTTRFTSSTITLTTPPITIDTTFYGEAISVPFGRFCLRLSLQKLFTHRASEWIDIFPVGSITPPLYHPTHCHPHIRTEGISWVNQLEPFDPLAKGTPLWRVCHGEAHAPLSRLLPAWGLHEAFSVMLSFLTTYNPASPYMALEQFLQPATRPQPPYFTCNSCSGSLFSFLDQHVSVNHRYPICSACARLHRSTAPLPPYPPPPTPPVTEPPSAVPNPDLPAVSPNLNVPRSGWTPYIQPGQPDRIAFGIREDIGTPLGTLGTQETPVGAAGRDEPHLPDTPF